MPLGRSKFPPFVVKPFPYRTLYIEDLEKVSTTHSISSQKLEHPIHLALKWKKELKENNPLTMAEIALKQGFSRARVTQIMNLLRLDKRIQKKLLKLSDPEEIRFFSERRLRKISVIPNPKSQSAVFRKLISQMKSQD